MTIDEKLKSIVGDATIEDINLKLQYFDGTSTQEPASRPNHHINAPEGL